MPSWDGADSLIAGVRGHNFAGTGFAALVYDFANAPCEAAVALAESWGLDFVYITDAPKASPWSELPSYWSELASALKASDSRPSPTPGGDSSANGEPALSSSAVLLTMAAVRALL